MKDESPTQNENNPPVVIENKTGSDEDLTTLNLGAQESSATDGLAEVHHQDTVSGARWFYWVAALSMINSIISLNDGSWGFLAGLGMTQLISGLAVGLSQDLGGAVTIVALVLDALVAGFFVMLGWFAQRHQTWAFILGLVVYGLDGVIFLLVQDWFPLAFHGFVLFCIFRGLSAHLKWKELQSEVLAPA
jgi:hypothetical protein